MSPHSPPVLAAAGLLICLSFSGAIAGETAGFPWIDPSGVASPLLLCSKEPSAGVRQQFDKFTEGKTGRVAVIRADQDDGEELPEMPKAIVRCEELTDSRKHEIASALAARPDHFLVWLSPQAALAVDGRRLQCLGGGNVTIFLAASAGRALSEINLERGAEQDLTMIRRAALERSLANFPPIAPPMPNVPAGTLLIHGGGRLPLDVKERFIELAGGLDAPIVVLPIAGDEPLPEDESRDTRIWTRAGATHVRSLRARTRAEVESPEFAAAIESAKAVWFSGGRQWRFVDAYLGTKAEELFRGVLARGGVIGGSSAGASIQSQYMPRGSPLGNEDIMAEGYERGLGFLPGAAVDQHFTQRERHGDMTKLMRRYPQLLGIGLDEGTAIVARGSTAEVIGRGGVHFYDYRTGAPAGDEDFTLVQAGDHYDLATRRISKPQANQ